MPLQVWTLLFLYIVFMFSIYILGFKHWSWKPCVLSILSSYICNNVSFHFPIWTHPLTQSAHPSFIFKGIIKSQMFRLRRLCSKESDFLIAIHDLKNLCINSGYDKILIDGILNQADTLKRSLVGRNKCLWHEDHSMGHFIWFIEWKNDDQLYT